MDEIKDSQLYEFLKERHYHDPFAEQEEEEQEQEGQDKIIPPWEMEW